LSGAYQNSKAKLRWRCEVGHIWEADASAIRQGRWCHICAGWVRGTIEEMRQLAEQRGGHCLSEKYVNSSTKLTWQCSEGHEWRSRPNTIQRGGWCPECSSGLGERITRAFFEQLFRRSFSKCRPGWLQGLELDGLCPDLGLAFEHQGSYHDGLDARFDSNHTAAVQSRDRLKKSLCESRGVVLIEIPEVPSQLSICDLKDFIAGACANVNVVLPSWFQSVQVELKEAYSPDRLEELRSYCRQFDGKLLSTSYVGTKVKYTFECVAGHVFEALVDNVRRGQWCAECAGNRRLDTEALRETARARGGMLLSKQYTNNSEKLQWQCDLGHMWWATARDVRGGSWCRDCGIANRADGQRLGIEVMRELAAKRGGECLSYHYVNKEAKLRWRCELGHIWIASAGKIRQGQWCPKCGVEKGASKRRLSISEMCEIAALRGGKCLSQEYTNARTKLRWQCELGHIWQATPDKIKRGAWCPTCRKDTPERKGKFPA
jgi:hypothetical protein